MKPLFFFTDEARLALEEVASYVAHQSQSVGVALRFIDRVHEVCDMLAHTPGAGIARPEFGDRIRSFPIGSYTIFYRSNTPDIWIVLIIHSARDIPPIIGQLMKLSHD